MSAYAYKRSTTEERLAHAVCIVEEWRAYVCDLSEAPSWVEGSDSGICCHSHRLILVDDTADLDRDDDEEVVSGVPVEADGPEYIYECIGSIVCEPLLDHHGRECERVNDEARREFYEDVAGSRFGVTDWTGAPQ